MSHGTRLLIEAAVAVCDSFRFCCIPRLYAAASLKPIISAGYRIRVTSYSAALCRGLIEAIDA